MFCSFSINDKSINKLPLFLLDVNVCCKCQKLPFNVLVVVLLSDFLNRNASQRRSASGSIPRRYYHTSGHGRGAKRSNSYVRIVFTSDRLPRRKFLNTASPKLAGISGLLSRSSIRLDSQTFNIIWHNLSLATTVRPSLSLWCARQGCSKPSRDFQVVATVLGVVECFRHARYHSFTHVASIRLLRHFQKCGFPVSSPQTAKTCNYRASRCFHGCHVCVALRSTG